MGSTAMATKPADLYPEKEAQRRFETALRAALNTPPTPMKDLPKKTPKKSSGASPAKRGASS
jgi:hypothetical protein